VHDQPNVAVHPHGPEILVLRLVQLVELIPGLAGLSCRVKRRALDGFLLIATEPRSYVVDGSKEA
jgi:hypothetical protein